jgi:hypothetical protein
MLTRRQWLLSVATSCLLLTGAAQAELPAEFQDKANKAVQALKQLAADPSIVSAAKAGASAAGMTNGKWTDLPESDTLVTGLSASDVAVKLAKSQQAGMGKLILRDKEGNIVAYAKGDKPFLYNASNRPNIKAALGGTDYIADKVAPDPSSQKPSVQVAVPVKDAGAVVGVIQAAVE